MSGERKREREKEEICEAGDGALLEGKKEEK